MSLALIQDPPKRPVYRERGKFRRETEEEMRARVGEYHYGRILLHRQAIRGMVLRCPWLGLLNQTSFGSPSSGE